MPASAPMLRPVAGAADVVDGGAEVVDGGSGPEFKRDDEEGDGDVEVVRVKLVCVVVGDAVVAGEEMLSVSTTGACGGADVILAPRNTAFG